MSDLPKVLPQERKKTFGGREWTVTTLNFNSLARIEEKYGDMSKVDPAKISCQLFLLWCILSQCEPKLTIEEVGAMLTIDQMDAATTFINEALTESGAFGNPNAEADPKNEEAAKTKPSGKRSAA